MSDVDDELLALAGGGDDSSDEQGRNDNASRSSGGQRSPSPPARNGQSQGVAARKAPAKKSKRRARSVDSEDEGEASSPGSPSSLQSAPMDESDSDDDTPAKADADDEENKYPIDGLFMSLAEKEEIMAMREMEREQILAERGQEKDRIQQNKLLRQLVSNEEQRNKKRTASAADLEDTPRKTSRARTKLGGTKVGETNSGIDTLKTRRAEKTERDRRREEGRGHGRGRGRRSSIQSERSYSDKSRRSPSRDSEVEWHESKRPSKPAEDVSPCNLEHAERVRMGRSRFGQVLFWPGMKDAVIGAFVRVSIGVNEETRENIYRVAIIKDVWENKERPYAFVGPKGTELVSIQYVKCAHGKAIKEFPYIACSDSRFTEAEWSRYERVCQAEGVSIPSKRDTLKVADAISALLDRRWTNEELNEKMKAQNELKAIFKGYEKTRLEYDLKLAKRLGNDEKAAELEERLDNYTTPRLCYRTSLSSEKAKQMAANADHVETQQDRIAKMNEINRRKNDEEVRAALARERKREKEIERRVAAGEDIAHIDPSRRVKTRAKFRHDGPDSDQKKKASQNASEAGTPANGTPKLDAQKPAVLPHIQRLQEQRAKEDENGLPKFHQPIYDDDVIAALDLEIDENILDD